jgi:CheY-like chemotaxis protein
MPTRDLDEARAIHAALIALFISEPGGTRNPGGLARAASLCEAGVQAVNDVECRVSMRGVHSLARLLYSDDGHAGLESGSLRGCDALRFQIFNTLSHYRGRLEVLENRPPSRPELPALSIKKGLRILVVEDNRDSADMLRKLLELCGYEVTVAFSAGDGLDAARRTLPDIVLCDIGLPDQDGFTLANALRDDPGTASARLIAVTAYSKEEDRLRSRQAGFQLHLVKPVDPQQLLWEIEQEPAQC